VREELRALCQSGTKSTARGEKNPAGGGRQHAFKGGLRDAAEGAGEVGQRVEEERGREGGGQARQETARAAGIGPRPAGAGGGTCTLQTCMANRRDRATVGACNTVRVV
jgi:hypothetical protein